MMRRLIILCCGLAACSGIQVPPEYTYREIQTSVFKIAVWEKIKQPNAPVKIYIEGDGHAFKANGRISTNPTPHDTLVRQLAFGDAHDNVVYMARPCQFVQDAKCAPKYWSTARFSEEAIQAQYETIKDIAGNQPLTLVGFSGGAQTAGLMAVKYADLNIAKLVTIAGNLDVQAWTSYHQLPPLTLSDDLHNHRAQYAILPQIHYVGTDDNNILPQFTENFAADTHHIIYIKNADHNTGWESAFKQIRSE